MSIRITFGKAMAIAIVLAVFGTMPTRIGQPDVQGQRRIVKVDQPPNVNSVLSGRQVIAYESIVGGTPYGTGDLYYMNGDGTGKIRIPLYGGGGTITRVDPALSPDGSRIAFASNPTGDNRTVPLDIFTMNLDGSGIVRLTHGGNNRQPAWSPDNSLIAFMHTVKDAFGPAGIYLMTANGGGLHQLPVRPGAIWPAWSPDSSRILYTVNVASALAGEVGNIYVHSLASPPGLGDPLIFRFAAWGSRSAWSPDGSKIALTCSDDNLCVMNADGTGIKALTAHGPGETSTTEKHPAWSPDGRKIAFEHFDTHSNPPFGSTNIFVVDAIRGDLSPPVRLTTGPFNVMPSWSKQTNRPAIHP